MLDDGADHEIERIALELRRPVDLGPGVDAAVMAALRAAPLMVTGASAPRRGGRLAWLLRARTVRLRISPVGALAAAGIAIAAFLGLRPVLEPRRGEVAETGEFRVPGQTGEHAVAAAGTPGAVAAQDTVFITRFVFVARDAKQVAIAGDFNDWDTTATRLVKHTSADGDVWTVDVPLPPGRYTYAFHVDGERWMADPTQPPAVGDDFGRPSSVVTVRGPQSL